MVGNQGILCPAPDSLPSWSISALASDLIGGENKEHNGDWRRGVTGEGREGSGDSKGCVPERNE